MPKLHIPNQFNGKMDGRIIGRDEEATVMPKKAKEFSALEVSRLSKPGNHAVGGVSGLYLYVNEAQGRSWVLRTMVAGKRKHLGLGGYPTVTLAQARDKAREARELVVKGVDPIHERKAAASALRAQEATRRTFEEVANAYMKRMHIQLSEDCPLTQSRNITSLQYSSRSGARKAKQLHG